MLWFYFLKECIFFFPSFILSLIGLHFLCRNLISKPCLYQDTLGEHCLLLQSRKLLLLLLFLLQLGRLIILLRSSLRLIEARTKRSQLSMVKSFYLYLYLSCFIVFLNFGYLIIVYLHLSLNINVQWKCKWKISVCCNPVSENESNNEILLGFWSFIAEDLLKHLVLMIAIMLPRVQPVFDSSSLCPSRILINWKTGNSFEGSKGL